MAQEKKEEAALKKTAATKEADKEKKEEAVSAQAEVVIHNSSLRSFIVQGGILEPGKEIKVSQATADKLIKLYPSEIRVIK